MRPDVSLREMPAPPGLAPYAFALAADVAPEHHGVDSALGTGRFVFLHDPDEPEEWGGPFRIVSFAQAPLETDMGNDPFLTGVAWSWLMDALDAHDAEYSHPSGTVTKILAQGFGGLAVQRDGAQLEIRASWSPQHLALDRHVGAWIDTVAALAGLPPVAEGVRLISVRRGPRG